VNYVAAGWSAAIVLIGLYGWRTIRRGRVLARNLPPKDETWR
jgi:hypothetical protein